MKNIVILIALAFGLTACTGTEITVRPDSTTIDSNFRSNCGSIAIKESQATQVYPAAGPLVSDFAKAVDRSGIANKVYYPTRPDDKTDITLDAKFEVTADHNMGAGFAKSIFTGLTLFILEPVFWYNHDYSIAGQVDIIKDNKIVQTINQKADAEMSLKWLSLGSTPNLELETLMKLKSVAYKQILTELNLFCKNR